MTLDGRTSVQEWASGWKTVLSGLVAMFFATTFLNSLGTFFAPLEAEFSWTRAQISMGATIAGVIGTFSHAAVGPLVDRFGARNVAIPAVIFYASCIFLLSQVGNSIWYWWISTAIIGVAWGGVSSTVWMTGVVSQFNRSRGLAIALTLMGTALALAAIPMLSRIAIDEFGWRGAYTAFASAGLLIVLPAVLLGFRDLRTGSNPAHQSDVEGDDLRTILTSVKYWKLACATVFAICGLYGLSIHAVPFLVDRGLSPREAAGIAGMIGLGSMAGRFLGGFALDHVRANIVGMVAFSLPIVGCCILLVAGANTAPLLVATFLLGISIGAEIDVIAYITSRLFGLRRYSTAFGLLVAGMSLGAGLGPLLAAGSHDRFGTYQPFLLLAIGGFATAALLIGSIRMQPAAKPAVLAPALET